MRPANPFIEDIPINDEGKLSARQIRLIHRMFLVRIVIAVVLCAVAYFLGDWSFTRFLTRGGRTPVVYYGLISFTVLMGVLFFYGLLLIWGVVRVWGQVPYTPMRKTTGVPTKHMRTVLYLPSLLGETKQHVHTGWVEVGDAPFGVLPSALFDSIMNLENATFYYISLRTYGYWRYLIVNYKPLI